MFLLVPAYPGCPGSKAVKRSLLLLLSVFQYHKTVDLGGLRKPLLDGSSDAPMEMGNYRGKYWEMPGPAKQLIRQLLKVTHKVAAQSDAI